MPLIFYLSKPANCGALVNTLDDLYNRLAKLLDFQTVILYYEIIQNIVANFLNIVGCYSFDYAPERVSFLNWTIYKPLVVNIEHYDKKTFIHILY